MLRNCESENSECVVLLATPVPEIMNRWRKALSSTFTLVEAGDFLDAERITCQEKPSVVLFDLSLPPVKYFEKFTSLLTASRGSRIILFSNEPDDGQAIVALKAGGIGYAHCDMDAVLLRRAIELVRKGEYWIHRRVIPQLLTEIINLEKGRATESTEIDPGDESGEALPSNGSSAIAGLTRRQQEIAYLIGKGSSNKEIADFLKITESTVKAHLSGIYRRLGTPDRFSLAMLVLKHLQSFARSHSGVEKS